jgi:RHS repeat-associated protein
MGHIIKFYKGTGSSIPGDKPDNGGTVSLSSPEDIYIYYKFDDLGRLILTGNVMPDNTWSVTEKCYDPLGNVVFESYAYKPDGMGRNTISFPVAPGSNYSISFPTKSSIAYGVFSTPFNSSTFSSPFSGDLDPFLRTRYVLKPDGGWTRNDYNGLITTTTIHGIQTQNGQTDSATIYTKDIFGRLITVTPPSIGANATYTYNGLDQLISATIGSQPARSFSYDALGHLLSSTTPERGTINYTGYDALGNLLSYYDANGNQIYNFYDSKGRITSIQSQNGYKAEWSYDFNEIGCDQTAYNGKLTKSISYGTPVNPQSPGVIEYYCYNGLNGRLGYKKITNLGKTFELTYSYDGYGNIKDEDRNLGYGAVHLEYSYKHGFLDKSVFVDGGSGAEKGAHKINYYPSGAIKEIGIDQNWSQNGKKIVYNQEEAIPRLDDINYAPAGWTTGEYNYDKAGNIKAIGGNTFYYDAAFRLTRAEVENSLPGFNPAPKYGFDYSYDDYGNMKKRLVSYLQGDTQDMKSICEFTASYDNSNRLTSYTPYGSSGKTVYFDYNGNQTQFGDQLFLYDDLNRLKTVQGNEHVYYYNANNERVAQIVKQSFVLGESTYYLKEGSATLGEISFKREDFDTTSIREKYFLYAGGNILTSSEKEYSSTINRLDIGDLPKPVNPLGMRRCLNVYAEEQGLRRVASLSDPITYSSKGQKYDISYILGDISDDLAGVMVRLGRIKDQGNSGNSGDNGNGCPRNDEDKVQFYYFLKDGLDPDFVFNRFGLCGNQDYGQIIPLSSGNTYPVLFEDLQKDKKYRVTLYAFTSWQADPNLGYNLMKIEEGSITVPKKEPSTYFQVKSALKEEGVSQRGKFRAKWGYLSGVSGYKIKGKKDNGETVLVGNLSSNQTEFEADVETIESLGLSLDSSYQLEGIGGSNPIIIGPIDGGLTPIRCPIIRPVNYTIPVIKRAYLLFNENPTIEAPKVAYIEWDCGWRRAPKYIVYKKVEDCSGMDYEPPSIEDFSEVIGITDNNYFVEELQSLPADNECVWYAVQPADSDGNPSGTLSYPGLLDWNDNIDVYPKNVSKGNDQREIEVQWKLYSMYTFDDFQYFPEGSGLSFEVIRAYVPYCPYCDFGIGEIIIPFCEHATDEDFSLVATTNWFNYTDKNFNPSDENPFVAYKVILKYNGEEIFRSLCSPTYVSYCYDSPQISGFSAYGTGETIPYWGWPGIKVHFTISPPLLNNGTPYITLGELYLKQFQVIVDNTESNVHGDDFTDITVSVQNEIEIVDITGWIYADAETSHSIKLTATDTETGCFSTAETNVTIPPYGYDCPATQQLQARVIVLGEEFNGELGSVLQVQIIWNNAHGNTIKIYGSTTGYENDFNLLAEVPTTQYYYIADVVLGATMYFKLESTLDSGLTQCTLCQSSYLQVEAMPDSTQSGATYYFYVRDHLGNTRLVLDSAGNYRTSFNYEPYGVELLPMNDNSGGSGNPLEKYKYTGQERDSSTNLDYMHFRYYASTMGRFLKPDNIIPNAANPQFWNLYSYVNGNPVNFNDPGGHYPAGFGGGITQGSMKREYFAPPSGTAWERTMVEYMTFMVTDYYNVVVTKDSNGNIISGEGTYLYSQAGSFFSGGEICAGRAGDAQSAVLSKDDPIWPILRVVLNIQNDLKVEIAFAIAKQEGVILSFKWEAGKSESNWGTFAEFKKWVLEDIKLNFDKIYGEAKYVLDVGHSHPSWASGNFSANEYRFFSYYAGTPGIDRVIVVNEKMARYYQ